MSNPSPSNLNRLPALLLLGIAIFGPPAAAVLTFSQAVTQNPWVTALFVLLYEFIVFFASMLVKVVQLH